MGLSWSGTVAMIDLRLPTGQGGRRRGRGRRRWGVLRGEDARWGGAARWGLRVGGRVSADPVALTLPLRAY